MQPKSPAFEVMKTGTNQHSQQLPTAALQFDTDAESGPLHRRNQFSHAFVARFLEKWAAAEWEKGFLDKVREGEVRKRRGFKQHVVRALWLVFFWNWAAAKWEKSFLD